MSIEPILESLAQYSTSPWQPLHLAFQSEVLESVRKLADKAFVQNDAEAKQQAEELIYRLSLQASFAAPLEANAAATWTLLMQAKLHAARKEHGGCKPLSSDAMAKKLVEAVEALGAFNHPVLTTLAEKLDMRIYQVWARNWYGSCHGFSHQLSSLVQRTSGKCKQVVLENLTDEFCNKDTHDNLRVRFYESIDLRFDPISSHNHEDWTSEATSLINLRTGLCVMSDPNPALGCFYSVEGNWPPECRKHIEVTKGLGVNEHATEYWREHGIADEHHSEEWLEVVQANQSMTDADRAMVVDGCMMQLHTRWKMYDAIAERIAAL